MDVAHPVSSLDRPTEDTAKGIKSGAVLLGVQLGNVHQQWAPRVAVLDMPHNLCALRTRIDSCNLQHKRHGFFNHRFFSNTTFSHVGRMYDNGFCHTGMTTTHGYYCSTVLESYG